MADTSSLLSNKSSTVRQIEEFTVRERIPLNAGPHRVIVMLHGWTGDVNSMWVFANRLPLNARIIAPQAPYASTRGGYSWRDEHLRPADPFGSTADSNLGRRLPNLEELSPAAHRLGAILTSANFLGCETLDGHNLVFDVMGFSQGGALAFTLAFLYPERVHRVVGMSTFMPSGGEVLALRSPLVDHRILIAHGSQDTVVPPLIARKTAALLEQAGADVAYCESDVGHKLGSDCFFALEKFMR